MWYIRRRLGTKGSWTSVVGTLPLLTKQTKGLYGIQNVSLKKKLVSGLEIYLFPSCQRTSLAFDIWGVLSFLIVVWQPLSTPISNICVDKSYVLFAGLFGIPNLGCKIVWLAAAYVTRVTTSQRVTL
jgi:hypothetical protein